MSRCSATLRILLSLVLVLNGIGGAMAATRMQLTTTPTQEVTAAMPDSMAGMPCHEQGAMGVGKNHGQPQKTPAVPDCCKGGACACACMSVAQAMLLTPSLTTPAWVHVSLTKRLSLGHVDPTLPHLIRPPIG